MCVDWFWLVAGREKLLRVRLVVVGTELSREFAAFGFAFAARGGIPVGDSHQYGCLCRETVLSAPCEQINGTRNQSSTMVTFAFV